MVWDTLYKTITLNVFKIPVPLSTPGLSTHYLHYLRTYEIITLVNTLITNGKIKVIKGHFFGLRLKHR